MSEPILRRLEDDGVSVPDDELLLRIVPRRWLDTTSGGAQSIAYQDQVLETAHAFGLAAPCMSVARELVWRDSSGRMDDLLVGFDADACVAMFTAKQMRELRSAAGNKQPQGVMAYPMPDAPWHAVVWDLSMSPSGSFRAL